MKKHPFLLAAGMGLGAAVIGAVIVMFLAASGSYSSRWLSGIAVLVIGAVLYSYHLGDGRYPIPRETKLKYSALCAAVGGVSGWMNYTVSRMTWGSYGVTSYGHSRSESLTEVVALSVLLGGVICYYGLTRQEEL